MFTGLIEKTTRINDISNSSLSILNPFTDGDYKIGDSISINGICLTVEKIEKINILFSVSEETYKKTNLRYLKKGDIVNIERAIKATDRFGGHFVSGHIDSLGFLKSYVKNKNSYTFTFSADTDFIVEKGSIAIDGISLTCFNVRQGLFDIAVIEHTYNNTNLRYIKNKIPVNIEYDMIAKYVLRKKIDLNFLKENGFIS
jgi:riboflavin synthase